MNYLKILKDHFNDQIISAKITEAVFGKTLTIEVNANNLDLVIQYTQQIERYLEEINAYPDDLNIEVLSKGEDLNLNLENLNLYLEKMVKLSFVKPIEKELIMIGKIIQVNDDSIILQWNQKGRIRKIHIEKENIKTGEIYIKF
ncbi:ribosome assembly cofactor RimP [Mycoplasmopsis citelli]|uniref:Ribosome maturation factor RimP C-terminal domain-containing protein n=1 Tax=Mycoplasmopsis citelli TaxID=171281 RepID=A0A449B2F8_9BACT|nr:ribosome assembly cofactor RimP [Mycoplasmopsis citelli]UUD36299.1 ribosome assembly cofactor RimP [Mycoplasmopsis citelli]VEU74735.1 Uncharacterised protein [Mycoplasmopsis citelli]